MTAGLRNTEWNARFGHDRCNILLSALELVTLSAAVPGKRHTISRDVFLDDSRLPCVYEELDSWE